MFDTAVRIAMEKSTNSAHLSALAALASEASAYDQAEEDFPRAMAQHRAKQGRKPESLTRANKRTLHNLAIDQEALLLQLREQYKELLSPLEIVSSLATALELDIPKAESLMKYVKPEDRDIVEARLDRKRSLLKAFRTCIAELRGAA